MKQIFKLIALILMFTNFNAKSQIKANPTNPPVDIPKSTEAVFKLYPTQNMWTFIKLNTRTGQMWQVQYHTDEKSRFETYLNLLALVTKEKEENGRFILNATQNIYSFILLDQIDGKTWQVQWSTKPESRYVLPIE